MMKSAFAVGRRIHRGADVVALAIDDMLDAAAFDEVDLRRAGADADHLEPGTAREIDQRAAGAAGSTLHQHGLALLERGAIVEQVIGDLIIGERGGLVHVGAVGQCVDRGLGRRVVFGVAAAAMRPVARRDDDALPGLEARHAGPDFLDDPAHFRARRRGQRGIQL
jgi:hypothetical protein